MVKIPISLEKKWKINDKNILKSRSILCDELIFKFSYHPHSGELLFAEAPMMHNIMIKMYGKYEFDDYIRGIYFSENSIVYLRGHERGDWLRKTSTVLRDLGVPKIISIIWGEKAANELEDKLKWA